MSRSRAFCFTNNNYADTEFEDAIECAYIVYGKETGDSGTPHLQGYVCFKNAKTLTSVIKLLKPRHVEVAKGNSLQNYEYCTKDGDFTERGVRPLTQKEKGESNKRRWEDALHNAQQGNYDEIPADIRFKYDRNIKRLRHDYVNSQKLCDTEATHLWYYGGANSGKTRKAREDHPDAYDKLCNKWWDGYEGEDTVIIDDFDIRHEKLVYHLKRWADRYPFRAEIKNSMMAIRPKLIIVTSNYHPNEIWTSAPDLQPIVRRFKVIHFSVLKQG